VIVVDTTVLASLLLPCPLTGQAEELWRQDPHWVAPPLWRSSWCNLLAGYLQRDLLQLNDSVALMEMAARLLREPEQPAPAALVLELAQRSGCPGDACTTVATALHLGLPLVSGDRTLLRAFPDVARPLEAMLKAPLN
jgi:hypothetical protein